MTISINAEKSFEKNLHPFMTKKKKSQQSVAGTYLNIGKAIYMKNSQLISH